MAEEKVVDTSWFDNAVLGEYCSPFFYGETNGTKCPQCQPNGVCDSCDSVEGEWIEAKCEYASTCDWCSDLTHHDLLTMDKETQLGYCYKCIPELPVEILENLEKEEMEY